VLGVVSYWYLAEMLSYVFTHLCGFSFYLLPFSSTKLENRRVEYVQPRVGEVGTSGRGEEVRKGGKRVIMV
jgi:hypothetical protein